MVSTTEPTLHAPHPPLEAYYADEPARRAWVLGLFDRTAGDYNRVERLMALGTGSWYRCRALRRAGLAPGMSVLDVGMGTGLVAREAAHIVGDATRIMGVDPCAGMIDHAQVPPGVHIAAGSAESLPVLDGSADFLSMGYALRHVSDLRAAFREFHRVLKPRGRLCILDITPPEGPCARAIVKAYMHGVIPMLARVVSRHRDTPTLMRYYWDTIEACATPAVILEEIKAAGFVGVRRHVELGIFSEYLATRPE